MTAYDKVVQDIADKLIGNIENYVRTGTYTRPWSIHIPRNVNSGKVYSGVNLLALLSRGKSSPVWGTYLQWSKLGYRCGKGTGVAVYSPPLTTKQEDENGTVIKFNRAARVYIVFNASDVVHLESGAPYPSEDPTNDDARNSTADAFFSHIDVKLQSSNKASYSPVFDIISMPEYSDFVSAEAYYSTLAHELVHWTGHRTRLARPMTGREQLTEYAKEELIAELGAVLISAHLGLAMDEFRNDHYEYLHSWLRALQSDKTYLRDALKNAVTAVSYIKELVAQSEQSELLEA